MDQKRIDEIKELVSQEQTMPRKEWLQDLGYYVPELLREIEVSMSVVEIYKAHFEGRLTTEDYKTLNSIVEKT